MIVNPFSEAQHLHHGPTARMRGAGSGPNPLCEIQRFPEKLPARVLVIGASNGCGLAARIVSAFGSGAATIGIAYERPGSTDRSATAGWYNNEAFKHEAKRADIPAWNINGDAYSEEVKRQTVDRIKSDLGEVDFVVYSIAAPRRIDPVTGDIYSTVIKPIGRPFTARGIDFRTGKITEMTAETATARRGVAYGQSDGRRGLGAVD